MSTEADRTYINLMIIRTLAVTKGRTSVHQIHKSIEPKMGIGVFSSKMMIFLLRFKRVFTRS